MGSRNVVVAALLMLMLGLAALLAAQVQVAAAYHRSTAEGVLRDYAALAASRLASSAMQDVYARAAQPTLAAADGVSQPPRDSLAAGFARSVRYTFRLDSARRLRTRGSAPGPAEVHWLVDTLTASAAAYERAWYFAAITGDPGAAGATLLLFRRAPDGGVVGGVADLAALGPLLADVVTHTPLLPRSLTRGEPLDSVGGVRFGDAAGRILHAADVPADHRFVGREALPAFLGGLWVETTLRPDVASRLLIGGLPRSRLPIVLAVFALAAALTVAALLLVRREADLARLRTDLIAGVSHELRTPLAQIRMFSETLLLARVRSDDERHRSVAIIDQEARRLTHLVENLLHFSRAERHLARVVPRPIDFADVVRQSVAAFAPLAAARDVQVRCEGPDALPGRADPDALRQIVLNLLDNAVKYGPSGQTVTVAVAIAAERARLVVDDAGPGIPAGERDRVWERFFRLPRDRGGTAAAGTGIGLAVVRELAALHGGRAWVENAPGGGARFVVEWPV